MCLILSYKHPSPLFIELGGSQIHIICLISQLKLCKKNPFKFCIQIVLFLGSWSCDVSGRESEPGSRRILTRFLTRLMESGKYHSEVYPLTYFDSNSQEFRDIDAEGNKDLVDWRLEGPELLWFEYSMDIQWRNLKVQTQIWTLSCRIQWSPT